MLQCTGRDLSFLSAVCFRIGDNRRMVGRVCYHCKQTIKAGEEHDCWTTTEAALTSGLLEDLREAWERLRETAVSFGDQRIYASHKSIMFSRASCYFFVRPKRNFLELCVFLGHVVRAAQVHRVDRASKSKIAHIIHVRHRDEVEAPITDWLQEAYRLSKVLSSRSGGKSRPKRRLPKKRAQTEHTIRTAARSKKDSTSDFRQ
jgi:Domain of unknown function (DUF5655)